MPATAQPSSISETDAAIIAWLEHRDQTSAKWLVQRYRPMVFAIARQRLPSYCLAEDTVQDVLARMFGSLHRYELSTNFAAWIGSIAQNHCANVMRSLHRYWRYVDATISVDTLGGFATELVDPHTVIRTEFRDIAARVSRSVMQLATDDRTIFIQHCVAGVSSKRLAHHLGISPAAVRVRAHRIRQSLRQTIVQLHQEEEPR